MGAAYGQFCPVAVASEVFAERWTPIVLRELLQGGRRFNEIHRGVPLMSRALLVRRLRELESAGVVTSAPAESGRGREYRLTEAGGEFRAAIEALGQWGQRWAVRVRPRNLDPGLLVWAMRRRIAAERLPGRRVVVHLRFREVPANRRGPRQFWLLLDRAGVEVCVTDPGAEVDLYVEADLAALTRVWLGDTTYAQAVRAGRIRVSGPGNLVRQFPSWLKLSYFAAVPRP